MHNVSDDALQSIFQFLDPYTLLTKVVLCSKHFYALATAEPVWQPFAKHFRLSGPSVQYFKIREECLRLSKAEKINASNLGLFHYTSNYAAEKKGQIQQVTHIQQPIHLGFYIARDASHIYFAISQDKIIQGFDIHTGKTTLQVSVAGANIKVCAADTKRQWLLFYSQKETNVTLTCISFSGTTLWSKSLETYDRLNYLQWQDVFLYFHFVQQKPHITVVDLGSGQELANMQLLDTCFDRYDWVDCQMSIWDSKVILSFDTYLFVIEPWQVVKQVTMDNEETGGMRLQFMSVFNQNVIAFASNQDFSDVCCVCLDTGTVKWNFDEASRGDCYAVTLNGNVLIATYKETLVCVHGDTGQQLWVTEDEPMSNIFAFTIWENDYVLVFDYGSPPLIRCFDIHTGKEVWKQQVPDVTGYSKVFWHVSREQISLFGRGGIVSIQW